MGISWPLFSLILVCRLRADAIVRVEVRKDGLGFEKRWNLETKSRDMRSRVYYAFMLFRCNLSWWSLNVPQSRSRRSEYTCVHGSVSIRSLIKCRAALVPISRTAGYCFARGHALENALVRLCLRANIYYVGAHCTLYFSTYHTAVTFMASQQSIIIRFPIISHYPAPHLPSPWAMAAG